MALTALGRTLFLLCVATLTPDVERVFLGAGHGRIRCVGVLAVALEAGVPLHTALLDIVVADTTVKAVTMIHVVEGHGWFFGLCFVDGENLGQGAVHCQGYRCRTKNDGKKGENNNGLSLHTGPSLKSPQDVKVIFMLI